MKRIDNSILIKMSQEFVSFPAHFFVHFFRTKYKCKEIKNYETK